MCGHHYQRITCGKWLSPTAWVSGTELRSLGLASSVFSCWAISTVPFFVAPLPICSSVRWGLTVLFIIVSNFWTQGTLLSPPQGLQRTVVLSLESLQLRPRPGAEDFMTQFSSERRQPGTASKEAGNTGESRGAVGWATQPFCLGLLQSTELEWSGGTEVNSPRPFHSLTSYTDMAV